ncbi:uncharacterized protein [Aegilops tauschii subsp. strangulata]|uniref:uncharacterized protein n=1 Tax=Aegilops tauschii subsp. strangulata TaxID=200361 RepID=UPI003CC8B070
MRYYRLNGTDLASPTTLKRRAVEPHERSTWPGGHGSTAPEERYYRGLLRYYRTEVQYYRKCLRYYRSREQYYLVFFDDILVFSFSLEEHKVHLAQVFDILQANKLYARMEKCSFGQQEVEYLGHIINSEGVSTDPSKIKAIQEWPTPTTVTELRSFLGLSGYYRRFIQGYGIICRPLFDCLKKDAFSWKDEQTEAFLALKQKLTNTPVLALPDFTKPFILEADACGYGLGDVLMQEGRPISYFSKSIGPKAAAMSTYDKEALAIIEVVKKWRHYFLATALLSGYNFTVEYKKGKENRVVDALSRVKYVVSALTASAVTPTWQSRKWHSWLALAEWWYNTSFHTALQMTPFQALYGFPPPMVAESALPYTICEDSDNLLQNREVALEIIKQNLLKAQERMKYYADKKRKETEFSVGDMVYLKLQPYRHTSLSLHRHLKLHSKFYGPFRVLERIGNHAYKLLLPEGCMLHNTFHVSQLKKHIGPTVVPSRHLSLVGPDGVIKVEPEAILERKLIPRPQGKISIPVVRWLVKWVNMPVEEATWEDSAFIQKVFPSFRA